MPKLATVTGTRSHIVKHAEGAGDGQDQPFEQAMANLAHACQIGPTRSVTTGQDRYVLSDGTDGGWTPVGPYVNADGSNSTARGKLYMKFIAGGTGTFGVFLTITTDGG